MEEAAFSERGRNFATTISCSIHVERIIGLLKYRYTIFKGPLPVSLLKHKGDADLANTDKVLIVCSALTNLSKSVVS